MSEPVWVLAGALLAAHAESIAEYGGVPGLRDAGLLESALARARNLYAYGERDLCLLAAAYAYGIVRNHPFVDGNKRAALTAAGAFLDFNGSRLVVGEVEAARQTLALADGAIDQDAFADWLRANVAPA